MNVKTMKMKRMMMLIWGVMISSGLIAQENVTAVKHLHKEYKHAGPVLYGYGCPVCLWNSVQPGKCIHHNVDLVPDGWYYCKNDVSVMQSKAGKCHRCGSELTIMQTGVIKPSQPNAALGDSLDKELAVEPATGTVHPKMADVNPVSKKKAGSAATPRRQKQLKSTGE